MNLKSENIALFKLLSLLSLVCLVRSQVTPPRPVTLHPMKLHVDLTRLENIKLESNGAELYRVFAGIIIPGVLKHIEETIYVKTDGYTTLRDIGCSTIDQIGEYFNLEVQADLVIFFRYVNKLDGSVASAISCQVDPVTKRPIAGLVNINIHSMGNVQQGYRSAHFMTILHEIYHVLGFTNNYYDKYRDGGGVTRPISDVYKKLTSGKF